MIFTFIAFADTTFAGGPGVVDTSASPHVTLRSLPMGDVKWTTGFWADRFELCHKSMLPTLHSTLLDPKCSAQLKRIKFMAGLHDRNPGGVDWADGDCYKWIETMAHVYTIKRDATLDQLMDEWIGIIAKAQDADGYISTNIGHNKHERLQMPYHHELYNMGHLLTAACIHHRATGKKSFLEVARKLGDFLYREFRPRPPRLVHFPWNPSVYMGLVEMYRTTGNRDYLELTEIMIGNRGTAPGGNHRNGGTDQTQDRVPLSQETEAVGHAVCGMYLYCGAADLYAETGDREILAALERIWESIALRKMDITGSVAMGGGKSRRGNPVHEAFGNDYAQPNLYNETCANIAGGMFSWRMLLLSGDAKYADLMERVAHNCLNASVDLEVWRDGVFLPENIELTPEHRGEFLGGVTVLKGKALTHKGRQKFVEDAADGPAPKASADWEDLLYRPFKPRTLGRAGEDTVEITLIPYYAWANRGLSMMEVWIPLAR